MLYLKCGDLILKKIKFIFILMVLFFICSCSSNKKSVESTDENYDKENEFINELLVRNNSNRYDWNCEVSLNDIKDISVFSNMFISDDGILYEFSLIGEYSTTKNNCLKIETDKKFEKFINGSIISNDKKIYGYFDGEFVERMYGWTGAFNYDLFDYNENVVVLNLGLDSNPKYGVVKDNKIFSYDTNSFNSDDIKSEKELYTFSSDESFVGIYGSYIKTNKAYYKYGIINKNECDKYVDIECEYGIVKDELVSNLYDEIYYINNHYFILKNDLNYIYTDSFGG